MIEFEKSFYVDRPVQQVFDFSSDPTKEPQWRDSSVSAERASEGPVGVGSTVRYVDKFMGRNLETTSELTAWDPPNLFAQKTLDGPVAMQFTMTFKPEGSGTRVTMKGQAEFGGFFKVAEGLIRKQLDKQLDSDLSGLKRALEEGGG